MKAAGGLSWLTLRYLFMAAWNLPQSGHIPSCKLGLEWRLMASLILDPHPAGVLFPARFIPASTAGMSAQPRVAVRGAYFEPAIRSTAHSLAMQGNLLDPYYGAGDPQWCPDDVMQLQGRQAQVRQDTCSTGRRAYRTRHVSRRQSKRTGGKYRQDKAQPQSRPG